MSLSHGIFQVISWGNAHRVGDDQELADFYQKIVFDHQNDDCRMQIKC